MADPQTKARYTLKLESFPSEEAVREACLIIYKSQTPTLVASLSTLPYTVGRSFSEEELTSIHEQLKELQIGHAFRSTLDPTMGLTFDPRMNGTTAAPSPENLTTEPLKRKGIPFSKKSILIVLAVIFLVFLILRLISSGTNLSESTSAPEPSSKAVPPPEADATMVAVQSRVQRKSRLDLQWSNAKIGDPLQINDSVRTYENSQAVIRYQEGSSILIKEDSLVTIGPPEKASQKEMELNSGSIQAKLASSDTPTTLRIKTAEGDITLSSSPTNTAEASVQARVIGSQLQVAVSSGKAILSKKSGEVQALAPLEVATISAGEIKERAAFTASLNLLSPSADARMPAAPYLFQWAPLEGASEYRLIISSHQDLESTLVQQTTASTEFTFQYLDPGELYWKVETLVDGFLIESPTQRIYVE